MRSEEIGRKLFDVPSQSPVVNLSGRELSKEIIESCRSGDRDAFRALYDLYKDRVYSIALYFFHGDPAVASDIVQQVFLKLMTSIRISLARPASCSRTAAELGKGCPRPSATCEAERSNPRPMQEAAHRSQVRVRQRGPKFLAVADRQMNRYQRC